MEALAQDARTALERSVLDAFQERRSPSEPAWLSDVRRAAFERFRDVGFPAARGEWKYTNVAPILKVPFSPAAESGPRGVSLRSWKTNRAADSATSKYFDSFVAS